MMPNKGCHFTTVAPSKQVRPLKSAPGNVKVFLTEEYKKEFKKNSYQELEKTNIEWLSANVLNSTGSIEHIVMNYN